MKNILYMHTGSGNHGCEALVRTTAKLLNGPENVQLWSMTKSEDVFYEVDKEVEKIFVSEQINKYSLGYFEALFKRKVLKQKDANQKIFLRQLFKGNIAISIGGDNYCYPWSAKQAVILDKEIRKHAKHSVLWGCSIDSEALTEDMIEDLVGFDLITARETLTYNLLKKINKNTFLVADPAFLLEKEEVKLPENFIIGNTVGINVSPLIMEYGEDSLILKNYEKLIEYILENTCMNICLIPHVVWDYNDDRVPCEYLYDRYKDTKRLTLIKDGNCKQLKYVISKCRFFVGARTHSTIAAYSSFIPTLVVGYSVKSKGIALDLFGDYKDYVKSVQEMQSEMDLVNGFIWILNREASIKSLLQDVIPDYREKAMSAKLLFEQMITGE